MNTQRIVVLGLAVVAAVGAALLVRGMMGGGTAKVIASVAPPQMKMSAERSLSLVGRNSSAVDPSSTRTFSVLRRSSPDTPCVRTELINQACAMTAQSRNARRIHRRTAGRTTVNE